MEDKDIVKALECCIKEEYSCNDCSYECDKHFNKKTIEFDTMPNGMSYDQLSCDEWLKKDALDLINRQKAEIERLTEENKKVSAYIGDGWGYVSFLEFAKNQRAEAIKEFAERLKELNKTKLILWHEDIDNLVKEMEG